MSATVCSGCAELKSQAETSLNAVPPLAGSVAFYVTQNSFIVHVYDMGVLMPPPVRGSVS